MHDLLKWFILILLFAPLFYFAFRKKNSKWYLFLACGLVGILPDHFAIELSASLPLLTAQRILILLILGFWIAKKWKTRKFHFPLVLMAYAAANVVLSVINTRFGLSGEIKNVAILLLEKVLLVIMLADMIETRKEFDGCVDATILGGVALFLIGIIQTIFEVDVASVLQLVDARTALDLTPRMGMVRAFGTSNAIAFGCYCAFMAFVIFYRLEKTGKQRYALALALSMIAMLCTLSRSAWLCAGAMILLLFVLRPIKLARRIWPAVLMTILICVGLFLVNGNFADAMLETGKSSLNTVLKAANIQTPSFLEEKPDTDLPADTTAPTETAPVEEEEPEKEPFQFEVSENFGLNAGNAAASRMVEWTAVTYMIEEGQALCGYGYNAFPRGKLHYFYPQFGFWTQAKTLDVGLLRVVTEYGLIGLFSYLALLACILIAAFFKRGKNGTFTYRKLLLFLIPLYLLLNFLAAFSGPFWLFIGLFYATKKLDKEGLREEEAAADYTLVF